MVRSDRRCLHSILRNPGPFICVILPRQQCVSHWPALFGATFAWIGVCRPMLRSDLPLAQEIEIRCDAFYVDTECVCDMCCVFVCVYDDPYHAMIVIGVVKIGANFLSLVTKHIPCLPIFEVV